MIDDDHGGLDVLGFGSGKTAQGVALLKQAVR